MKCDATAHRVADDDMPGAGLAEEPTRFSKVDVVVAGPAVPREIDGVGGGVGRELHRKGSPAPMVLGEPVSEEQRGRRSILGRSSRFDPMKSKRACPRGACIL